MSDFKLKTINIGHNYFIRGGSDRVLVKTVELMNVNGHIAIPFCSSDPRSLPNDYLKYFVNSINTDSSSSFFQKLSFFYNSDAKSKLMELLRIEPDIDVAHLHIYYGKITTSILKPLKDKKIKIIQSLHEYKLACPIYTMERNGNICDLCINGAFYHCAQFKCKNNSLLQSLVMTIESYFSRFMGDIKLIDKFISVSYFHKGIMEEVGIPSDKIEVLHNFVDVSSIEYKPFHSGYFLYFGRIEKLKGIDTLLESFSRISDQLLIVGDGSYVDVVKEKTSNLDNVSFLGFKEGDELQNLIANSIGVIVPSEWYENCPMTILEAKAHGRPVIGTNIGGIPELITNGIDGYIIPCRDTVALRNAIVSVKQHFLSLSHNARIDAENRFSKEAYLQKLLNIYESA